MEKVWNYSPNILDDGKLRLIFPALLKQDLLR